MAGNAHEIYRGRAVIMAVEVEGVEDWFDWEKKNLSEADRATAFKIVYGCACGDANGDRYEVKVEVSNRELVGKALEWNRREDGGTPTQIDIAVKSLKQQGLLPRDATGVEDIGPALDDSLVGREVTIRVYEEPKDDGTFYRPKAVFASKFARITGDEKLARLAAFKAGKPVAAPAPKKPAKSANVAIPAPLEDEEPPF